jgi:hypothetical protein
VNPKEADREEFVEQWQEFFQEILEEHAVNQVEDVYEDILRENLDSTAYLDEMPEQMTEALAEMAAGVYGEQAQRILDSGYVGQDELGIAVATAFLDSDRQVKVGVQAQGIVDLYWDEMPETAQRHGKDQYQEWAFEALTEPWPPEQLNEWEHVDRFKPPADDRTYM